MLLASHQRRKTFAHSPTEEEKKASAASRAKLVDMLSTLWAARCRALAPSLLRGPGILPGRQPRPPSLAMASPSALIHPPPAAFGAPCATTTRTATKKAGGSSNNSRDSAGRRLGIKVWPGTASKPGGIIVRQRGKKFLPGDNVGIGNDHTIWAKVGGVVRMERVFLGPKKKRRNLVHVLADAGGSDFGSAHA